MPPTHEQQECRAKILFALMVGFWIGIIVGVLLPQA